MSVTIYKNATTFDHFGTSVKLKYNDMRKSVFLIIVSILLCLTLAKNTKLAFFCYIKNQLPEQRLILFWSCDPGQMQHVKLCV